jgi:hypothetical protein
MYKTYKNNAAGILIPTFHPMIEKNESIKIIARQSGMRAHEVEGIKIIDKPVTTYHEGQYYKFSTKITSGWRAQRMEYFFILKSRFGNGKIPQPKPDQEIAAISCSSEGDNILEAWFDLYGNFYGKKDIAPDNIRMMREFLFGKGK